MSRRYNRHPYSLYAAGARVEVEGGDDPAERLHRHRRLHHRQWHLCVADGRAAVHGQCQHVPCRVGHMRLLHHDW